MSSPDIWTISSVKAQQETNSTCNCSLNCDSSWGKINKGTSDKGVCVCAQSYLTLCDTIDCSPSGSSVHGIFSRLEYWSGLPFPPPGDLPDPGIKPMSPALASGFFTTELPGKPVTWAGYKSPFPITAVSAYSVPWTSSTMWDVLPYLWLSLLFHSWWYKLIFCDFSKKQLDN